MKQEINLTAIVIEDNLLERKLLEEMIHRHPNLTLTGSFTDAESSAGEIRRSQPDLIFLDINLPGVEGMKFAKLLKTAANRSPRIIFVTAHRRYAVEAFEIDADDYIVKPILTGRFNRAVEKSIEAAKAVRITRRFKPLHLPSNGKALYLDPEELIYAEAKGKETEAVTASGRFPVKLLLGELEQRLEECGFLRIHRSYLVNLRKS